MDKDLFDSLCESIKEAGRMRRAQTLQESTDERTKMVIEMNVTQSQGLALRAMFEYWNHLANIGGSRKVGFYVDGDGNFKPECNVKFEATTELTDEMRNISIVEDNDGDRTYDFDPIAWKLDRIENPEDWEEK